MQRIETVRRRAALPVAAFVAMVGFVLVPTQARAQGAGKVYALLVIDTGANLAGVERDGQAVKDALKDGFGDSGRLELTTLRGPNVNPLAILDYYAKLPRSYPAAYDDALFFYYSGHGATFNGKAHTLTTSHGNLERAALRRVMEQRRSRLTVILSDCCATIVKVPASEPYVGKMPPQEGRIPMSPVARCLFFEHRGVVDVNSSSYGESAWGDTEMGGFFTSALSRGLGLKFIDPLDNDGDKFVTWNELFTTVRRDTQQIYQTFRDDQLKQARADTVTKELRAQPAQVPEAFALADRVGADPGNLTYAPNLGIEFELVPAGNAMGARLTKAPIAGSGAARLGLVVGDVITLLDDLPIRYAVDVMNHHGVTDVVFKRAGSERLQKFRVALRDFTPPPPEAPVENSAPNIGIFYQLVPYEGKLGARLSRTSYTGPAATIPLEQGDMILRIDGQPITKPEDVTNHVDDTTFEFINNRTGNTQTIRLRLPSTVAR
jgi:hypothetical protein